MRFLRSKPHILSPSLTVGVIGCEAPSFIIDLQPIVGRFRNLPIVRLFKSSEIEDSR